MAPRNNHHGQHRAHKYRQGHQSRPGRDDGSDVELAMRNGSSYIFTKSDEKKCRLQYDSIDMSKKKYIFSQVLLWLGMIATTGFIGYILAYTIMAVMKTQGHTDTNSPEFTLYKNSQFASCANDTPQRPVNCTLLEANLDVRRYPDLDWVGQQNLSHYMSGPEYQITNDARDYKPSWCDLASCLAKWKVIPSTPRQSAFGLTALDSWMHLLIVGIGALWPIRKMLSPPKACTIKDPVDWSLLIWKVGQLGLWWWAFGSLVSNPDESKPVSLVSWVSTWTLATNFRFHPWSCHFHPDSWTRRGIAIGLNVLTFIQWAATIHALRLQDDRHSMQKYDCLSSGIGSAPGSSTCTAEQLCSKTWLFQNPDFMSETNETSLTFYKIMVYYQIVAYPLLAVSEAGSLLLFKGRGQKFFRYSPLILFLLGGYLGIFYGVPYFIDSVPKLPFDVESGLATVAYDFSCRAIHIGISPTYAYEDINAFARALRITRMWFNA